MTTDEVAIRYKNTGNRAPDFLCAEHFDRETKVLTIAACARLVALPIARRRMIARIVRVHLKIRYLRCWPILLRFATYKPRTCNKPFLELLNSIVTPKSCVVHA